MRDANHGNDNGHGGPRPARESRDGVSSMAVQVTFGPTTGNGDAARANQYLTAFAVFATAESAAAVADAASGIADGINADSDASTPHGPVIVARDGCRVIVTVRNRRTARATASGVAWGTLGNAIAAAIPAADVADAVDHDGTDADATVAAGAGSEDAD